MGETDFHISWVFVEQYEYHDHQIAIYKRRLGEYDFFIGVVDYIRIVPNGTLFALREKSVVMCNAQYYVDCLILHSN